MISGSEVPECIQERYGLYWIDHIKYLDILGIVSAFPTSLYHICYRYDLSVQLIAHLISTPFGPIKDRFESVAREFILYTEARTPRASV